MRFNSFLTLLVVSFIVSGLCFADADKSSLNNKATPASDIALIDSDHKVRRLRGRHKENNEERAGVPAAAYMNLLSSTPTTSTQILHVVENNKPLPKWTTAFLVLLGVGALSGTIYGGIKLANSVDAEGQ